MTLSSTDRSRVRDLIQFARRSAQMASAMLTTAEQVCIAASIPPTDQPRKAIADARTALDTAIRNMNEALKRL